MTEPMFYVIINRGCELFKGSITSSHRTVLRNKIVGGAENSQHLGYRAADVVLDDWKEKINCIEFFKRFGLYVLDEVATKNHLHVDDRHNSQAALYL